MLRKLSPIERFTCLLGLEEPVCFAMTARFRGPIPIELLQAALDKVRRRHPLAAVRVVDGPAGEPWYQSTVSEPAPLRVIEPDGREDWTVVVARELTRLMDPRVDPLVRFIWIQGPDHGDLVLICHHAVADGLSTAYMMRDVHRFLGDSAAEVEPLALMPPMEDLIPAEMESAQSMNLLGEIKTIVRNGLPGRVDRNVTPQHPRFRLLTGSLEPDLTALLTDKSRAMGTSVHGAIGAAFLLSFAGHFGEATGYRRTLQTPINLRHLLTPPTGEAFGFFVSQVHTEVDCAPGRDFWEVARDLREGVVRQSAAPDLLRPIVQLKQILGLGISFGTLYRLGKGRTLGGEHDLTVSNIGRLDFPARVGDIELTSLHGPTFSAMRNGKLVGVCSLNGTLTLTFLHETAGLGEEIAGSILASAMRHLETSLS